MWTKLTGRVVDGRGDCSKWSNKLLKHYQRLSGLALVKGTLNIVLPGSYSLSSKCQRLPANDWDGSDDVLLEHCQVNGHPGVIIRTQDNELNGTLVPKSIVEVASDTNLRCHFNLRTGDSVELEVP